MAFKSSCSKSSRGFPVGTCVMFVVWTGFLISMAVSTSDLSTKTKCYRLTLDYREVVSSKSKANRNVNRITSPWRCYCYEGQRQALYLLWSNPVISLRFADKTIPNQFIIIHGNSEEAVWEYTHHKYISYIEDLGLYPSKDREDISLEAFSKSCVAIKTDLSYKITFHIENVALWSALYLVAGIDIFLRAKGWSRNRYVQYGARVAMGVMTPIVFLIIYLRRQFKQSLQWVILIIVAAAMSPPFQFWTHFMKQMFDPITSTMIQYWQYILGYVLVTGLISLCAYGPVTDSRSLNLIQWFIQLVSLVLIYQGTQIPELSVAIMILILITYNINLPKGWFNFFTPKRKLLTEDEYIKEANEETNKALEELRSFCQSPQCDTWKLISHLSTPVKFAKFVEGDSWHVTDKELLDYYSGPEVTQAADLDSSDEDELDFIQSSS